MTATLWRKLLRNSRVPMIVVAILLFAFAAMWVKVTQKITTQIMPMLDAVASLQRLGAGFFQDQFFHGPGKLMQTMLGGEDVRFTDPQDTLAIGLMHPFVQAVLCIWAVGRAAGAVAGEVDRGTMELLMAQPIPRRSVIFAHLAVDLVAIPVFCFALWLGMFVGTAAVGTFRVDPDVYAALHMPQPAEARTFTVSAVPIGSGLPNTAALIFAVSGITMAHLGRR